MNTIELRVERMRNGVSTEEMASVLGFRSADAYRKHEKGIVEWNTKQILAAAERLNLTLEGVNVIFFDGKLPTSQVKRTD